MEKPWWIWLLFIVIILVLLLLDLGVFHKEDKEIGFKESIKMSGFYILISLLFSSWIWFQFGSQSAAEYLTGFLVEKSLSLDNIFIISLIFSALSIPVKYQHRVLFWGIVGVIVLRAVMIALGAQLLANFTWVIYLFAIFMIVTGIKMFFVRQHNVDIENNFLLKWMRKHLPISASLDGNNFLTYKIDGINGRKKLYMTPLLVALILVEFVDLVFAVDSIPAVFTITNDPYIVYTSNIFAILGLRALYFALASIIQRFYYLKFALALVLIFIGSKIFIADFLGLEKFPPMISLSITFGLLAGGCLFSLRKTPV